MQVKTFVFSPFQENTYLIYDESNEAVLIDAGNFFPQENEELQNFIQSNNLNLKRLINTHLHLDHQFGNHFVSQTYKILPEAHKADEFFIDKLTLSMQKYGLPDFIKAQKLGNYLDESDIIEFGNSRLSLIHTPGHSPGSLCFYNKEEGILFSGDVLFEESIGRTDLEQGNYETLTNSITQKLFLLPDSVIVYPGHGESTTIAHEKKFNPYL